MNGSQQLTCAFEQYFNNVPINKSFLAKINRDKEIDENKIAEVCQQTFLQHHTKTRDHAKFLLFALKYGNSILPFISKDVVNLIIFKIVNINFQEAWDIATKTPSPFSSIIETKRKLMEIKNLKDQLELETDPTKKQNLRLEIFSAEFLLNKFNILH